MFGDEALRQLARAARRGPADRGAGAARRRGGPVRRAYGRRSASTRACRSACGSPRSRCRTWHRRCGDRHSKLPPGPRADGRRHESSPDRLRDALRRDDRAWTPIASYSRVGALDRFARAAARPRTAPMTATGPRDRRTGRRPPGAVPRPHRRRAGRRHRQRQVEPVQRADRHAAVAASASGGRPPASRTPASGAPSGAGGAARLARHPGRPAVHPGQPRSTRRRCRAARARAARPARLRLDPGRPPAGGRPAAAPGRPGRLGDRPAEVRRPGHPRAVPAHVPPARRQHRRRAQPGRPAVRGGRTPLPGRPDRTAGRGRVRVGAGLRDLGRRGPARASIALRQALRTTVSERLAALRRLSADVDGAVADAVSRWSGRRPPRTRSTATPPHALADALADSAGVPAVVEATGRAYRVPGRRLDGLAAGAVDPADAYGPAATAAARPGERTSRTRPRRRRFRSPTAPQRSVADARGPHDRRPSRRRPARSVAGRGDDGGALPRATTWRTRSTRRSSAPTSGWTASRWWWRIIGALQWLLTVIAIVGRAVAAASGSG